MLSPNVGWIGTIENVESCQLVETDDEIVVRRDLLREAAEFVEADMRGSASMRDGFRQVIVGAGRIGKHLMPIRLEKVVSAQKIPLQSPEWPCQPFNDERKPQSSSLFVRRVSGARACSQKEAWPVRTEGSSTIKNCAQGSLVAVRFYPFIFNQVEAVCHEFRNRTV